MMFLIRTAFWLSVLLLVLPLGGGDAEGPSAADRASIDGLAALAAAGATVSDMRGFCERQPGACDIGSQAFKLLSERARTGAVLLEDYLGAPGEGGETALTSATKPSVSRDTLTPADRKPTWRGPVANRAA